MEKISKKIERLKIYKLIIRGFHWLLSPIGIALSFRFPEHYICIFVIFLLSMLFNLEINTNIDYQIKDLERLKRMVE